MKIIICDDNKQFVKQISNYIDRYSLGHRTSFQKYHFYDAGTMFEFYKNCTDVAVVILDVVFDHSNGVEVAKQMRAINIRTRILFVSSFEKYAVKGYGVNADGYLVKPIEYEEFEKKMDEILPKVRMESGKIFLENTERGKVVIDMDEICFIETSGRKTKIHTMTEEYVSCQKMKVFENKLQKEKFYRCHAAYIVNLQSIRRIDGNTVILKDGSSVLISKSKKKDFMKEFTKYVSEMVRL